eukprot:IDg3512t1
MTGYHQGSVTRVSSVAISRFKGVLYRAHKLDLCMQSFYFAMPNNFYKMLTLFLAYLGRQQNFITDTRWQCPVGAVRPRTDSEQIELPADKILSKKSKFSVVPSSVRSFIEFIGSLASDSIGSLLDDDVRLLLVRVALEATDLVEEIRAMVAK